MTDPKRKLKVFLCHASQDKPVVRELYQKLLAEGWIDPWLDEEKLLPGMDWGMEIEKAVETSQLILVCLSQKSVSKEGYVQKELRLVLDVALNMPEGTIFVIPLRIDVCDLPRQLRSWQWVDYFPENRSVAYEKLLTSLKIRAKTFKIPTYKRAGSKPASSVETSKPFPLTLALDAITPLIGVSALKTIIETDLPKRPGSLTADLLRTTRQHTAFAALAQMNDPDAIAYLQSLTPKDMLFISSGEFPMGSERYSNERPLTNTWVNSFYMAPFPVTNGEYRLFIVDGGYSHQEYWTQAGWNWVQNNHKTNPWKWNKQCYLEKVRHPVEWLSWYEAMAYARWRSLKTGALFRLPTEAEWEKAASWDAASNTKLEYPWGDHFDGKLCNLGSLGTQPVGHFSPAGDSPYHIADMVGQIWQWTNSLRKPYPYYADPEHESVDDLGERVFRGGCWANYDHGFARCASRYVESNPIWPDINTNGEYEGPCGLRLVLGAASWLPLATK